MLEHEWFVSILSGPDMRKIRGKISGFPPDLANPRLLKEELLKAFSRGAGAGPRNPRLRGVAKMNLRDLYTKIAEEYLASHPETKAETFDLFMIWLQGQNQIRPYEKIALLNHFYAKRFNQSLELLIHNAQQKKGLFEGLVSNDFTPKDRVGILLGLPKAAEQGKHLLEIKEWAQVRHPQSHSWQMVVEGLKDEDLPDLLQAHEKETRWILLVYFLLTQDRYTAPENAEWLTFVIASYDRVRREEDERRLQTQQEEEQKALLEIKSLIQQQKEIACTLDTVQTERQLLQNEIERVRYRLTEVETKTKALQQTLSEKNIELEVLTHANADYQHFLSLLHEKYDLSTIVCMSDHSDFFAALFFQLPVIQSVKDLPNNISLVLIDRTAFPSTSEYLKLCRALKAKEVSYHEVTSYDEITHIRQILNQLDLEG